jgi:hypothetical protein
VKRACAVAIALVLASCGGDDEPPLDRALALVEDEGEFSTALESGDTLAHVAELLMDAGEPAASAWVQVVAVETLDCSLPEIHDVRQAVRELLSTPTELPVLPSC